MTIPAAAPSSIAVLEAEVLDHQEIAPEHFVLTMDAPQIAARARPGQFVMVRSVGWDPLLPRAYSVYHADAEGGCVSILYREVGRGTQRLRLNEPGQRVHLWGPLGNHFRLPEGERVLLVGGGVGVPPLVFWAEYLAELSVPMEMVALVGAARAEFVVGVGRFREARALTRVATDDGSAGHHGYVTDLLPQFLDGARATIYACGPMPMLAAVARIAEQYETPAQLALEAPMACGVGACLGCTVPKRSGDFARVCTDGPVFAPGDIAWQDVASH
ncbi:MAG TPA: dihydroorotate dehydrogenase electron transfer subunit [Armatimonadota bacterium]|nr:dihydroorotate dehydrogenase electron transfer subunit [Armatimonadota bacterium]